MKTTAPLRAIVLPVLGLCALFQLAGCNLTPPAENPIRQGVIDGLRREMADLHDMDLVFEVEYLKVKDGWAWISARPQSPNGVNRYEGVSALLRLGDNAWEVVELPCTEAENPECLGAEDYYESLLARYPSMRREILPELDCSRAPNACR